jgi:hypothetical protein
MQMHPKLQLLIAIFSFFKSPKIKSNAQIKLGPTNFASFARRDLGSGYLGALFACQKVVFWLSSLYLGNKPPLFCLLWLVDAKIVIWQAANS